jgi:hypothetical protein
MEPSSNIAGLPISRRITQWLLFLVGCVAVSTGCADLNGSDVSSLIQAKVIVSSTPFGETNGKDEYNASGIVALADSRFLFCDNNTGNALFELNLTPEGLKKGPLIRRPLLGLSPDAIDDLEDMTLVEEDGHRLVFVASSLYIKKTKKGKVEVPPGGILRVAINADDTLKAENLPGFREWLIGAYAQLAASSESEPDEGGLNIEGLAWDKSRHALLFGVRTPVPGGKPLVLPVKVKDLSGPWTTENLEALPAIQLAVETSLGEQGIRGLFAEPDREAFLVLAGKAAAGSKVPFALYEWAGDAEGKVRKLDVEFAPKFKPEGLTRGTVGGKKALLVVDDAGGFQVVWE